MANDVENIFRFECTEARAVEVAQALRKIAREVDRKKFAMGDHRTRWEPNGDESWRFLSPWGPAENLQDEITRQLAAVDPTVVVTNYYSEEFGQFVGARITRVKRKMVKACVLDGALNDRTERIVEERVHLCDEGCCSSSLSARPRARIAVHKSKKTRRSGS